MGVSRSLATVAVNNDKAGYSLTAGSYSIRTQSVQRGTITISSDTSVAASISAVALASAPEMHGGFTGSVASDYSQISLSSTTTVLAESISIASGGASSFVVPEYF